MEAVVISYSGPLVYVEKLFREEEIPLTEVGATTKALAI